MNLSEVLAFLGQTTQLDVASIKINNICIDSRRIQPGDLFVAIPGYNTDGRQYIGQAITNGALAVLAEEDRTQPRYSALAPIISIKNLAEKVPELAAYFYKFPSNKLKVIGVTGTNGKTSCSHYVAQILNAVGLTCGVMGTLGNGLLGNLAAAQLTTADCCTVQQQFADFVLREAKYVAMEVSSHALQQQRLVGANFEIAIFTNLSQDHLDYHGTMQEYFQAKLKLFTEFKPKYCVINLDDPYSAELLTLIPKECKVFTYSLTNSQANVYLNSNTIITPFGKGIVNSPLIGAFNASNLLACITSCLLLNINLDLILNVVPQLVAVNGRMQNVNTGTAGPQVIVDYAHTPDALLKVLQTLRAENPAKLYCIFGCGGDRDRSKRPLMLQAAMQFSDQVIITQDNPRTEDPQQIINDILMGTAATDKISIESDRAEAIKQTIARAQLQDVVLIAGKGHEDYQIIGTVKRPFSDFMVAQQALADTMNSEPT